MRTFLALLLGMAIGLLAGAIHWRREGPAHFEAREAAIMAQAPFVRGGVLLIGDSLTERAYVPRLCGLPVLNAGMGGAKAGDVLDIAVKAKAAMKPKLVIVAMGTNDAHSGSLDIFGADFAALVEAVEPDAVVGVARKPEFNAIIRRGGRYIEPVEPSADGVHLDAAGAANWIKGLERACHNPYSVSSSAQNAANSVG